MSSRAIREVAVREVAIREVSGYFARVRPENDGEEPWSEEDLFDLDSALAFGGSIEEIAIFLKRDVEEVQRKASERNWPDVADPGPLAPADLVNPVEGIAPDCEKRTAEAAADRGRSEAAAADEVAALFAIRR
jgi:hypothetical protein